MTHPTPSRQLSLNLFIFPGGHHEAAWRHPDSPSDRIYDITFYQELAQRAEAVRMDAIFFADSPTMPVESHYAVRSRFEPITWLAGIAAATRHIGLIATASTSFYEPYNLARLFATVDLMSGGRAGWNIVTTSAASAAANYGQSEHGDPAVRYARAAEFVDTVTALWDSWDADALAIDRETGVFADTRKIHPIDHRGTYFNVQGAFNMPRSPQGRPVLVQAGSSEIGRDFAATYAEAVFTAHQNIDDAVAFYGDLKSRAQRLGRPANAIRILPGICPYIGDTEQAAQALHRELNALVQLEFSLGQLGNLLGVDLHGIDLDRPLPIDDIAQRSHMATSSRFKLIADIVKREQATPRQVIGKLAGARGHWEIVGTAEQVADAIETWFTHGAADGFNVMPPMFPHGFSRFADRVVPLLQQRGLFRTAYEGRTLRDHFGLAQPLPQTFSRTLAGPKAS